MAQNMQIFGLSYDQALAYEPATEEVPPIVAVPASTPEARLLPIASGERAKCSPEFGTGFKTHRFFHDTTSWKETTRVSAQYARHPRRIPTLH